VSQIEYSYRLVTELMDAADAAWCHIGGMKDATYRIIPSSSAFKVEITRPGETILVTEGFESETAAQTWIDEDKRVERIDDSLNRPTLAG
jgi:hypothetical protein